MINMVGVYILGGIVIGFMAYYILKTFEIEIEKLDRFNSSTLPNKIDIF